MLYKRLMIAIFTSFLQIIGGFFFFLISGASSLSLVVRSGMKMSMLSTKQSVC